MSDVQVREAREQDVDAVRALFQITYGDDYPYQQFYDAYGLKKTIYSDNYLFLVATIGDDLVGTGAIYFEVGAYTDLLGEFGRLVVHPDARGQGVGGLLMEARIRFARERLHVGFIEGRTRHPFAQRIAEKYGFVPYGLIPLKFKTDVRESLAVMGRLFGEAQALRRNHPRVIPEIFPLAAKVLHTSGLPNDLIVAEDTVSYPMGGDFEVAELTEKGIPHLLRIERGRLKRREIFGNMMLSYGHFALRAKEAKYLVARRDEIILGAVGYVYDEIMRAIRIFELIDVTEEVTGFLLREVERHAREDLKVHYAEVIVSAYWPQMQRTLEQLGFCPVAYFPAYVFRGVERLDAVRMAKVYVPFDLGDLRLIPSMQEMRDLVVRGFLDKRVGIQIDDFTRDAAIFRGLHEAQLHKISNISNLVRLPAGHVIFRQGEVDRNLYMVVEGAVDVKLEPGNVTIGRVLPGDVLGEISLIERSPHFATAVTATDSRLIVLQHDVFEMLLENNPRIGMQVMRNLAHSLGHKLKATDVTISELYGAQAGGGASHEAAGENTGA